MERWRLTLVFASLWALAIAGAMSGRFALALPLAGLKAVLVGAELMELRLAHRLHLVAYAAWALATALALTLWLA